MGRFVSRQGLPKNPAELAAVSFKNAAVLEKLNSLAIETIEIPENAGLSPQTADHADMNLCCLYDGCVFVLKEQDELGERLKSRGFNVIFTEASPQKAYPGDILLNCLLLSGRLYCRADAVDDGVKAYCKENDIEICKVNQGYSRCASCVVDENSVITADKGICRALSENGTDVLLIGSGNVSLTGYDTGFIGGCAAKISGDKILFTGSLESHPDGNPIRNFINSKGIEIIECANDTLVDIGGIAVLKER